MQACRSHLFFFVCVTLVPRGPVGDGFRGPVGDELRGPVGDALRGPVGDGLRGPVGDGLRGPVGDGLRGPVGDGLRGPVGDGLRDQLCSPPRGRGSQQQQRYWLQWLAGRLRPMEPPGQLS